MPRLSESEVLAYAREASAASGVPPRILAAMAYQESGYDPAKFGALDEIGLMQIRPATAREWGFSGPLELLLRPRVSMFTAAGGMARLYRQFGTWGLALSAYNAGPGAVERGYRGNLQSYVRPILERAGFFGSSGDRGRKGFGKVAIIVAGLVAAFFLRRRLR